MADFWLGVLAASIGYAIGTIVGNLIYRHVQDKKNRNVKML